jgi:hypothetical protein
MIEDEIGIAGVTHVLNEGVICTTLCSGHQRRYWALLFCWIINHISNTIYIFVYYPNGKSANINLNHDHVAMIV